MKATLIFNPAAGSAGAATLDRAQEVLRPHYELTVEHVAPERDVATCVHAALAAGAEVVIAAGGDGTVSAVATVLAGTRGAALGILPCGTSNSLAAALGIPGDLEGACAVLAAGPRRRLDTARCGDRLMVLHASVGLHADTVRETQQQDKHRFGVLAYAATALRKLSALAPFEVALQTDDQIIHCRAVAVTVANVAPPKTVLAQGPAELVGDDGLLDVTVVAATNLVDAVATGIHLFRSAVRGEPATRDEVGYFSCRRLRIETNPPQHVLVDGEDAGTTPLMLECRPASLLVVAPEPPEANERFGPTDKLPSSPDADVEVEPTR